MRLLILLALVGLCAASCPNDCNGHGVCNHHSACECYRNWQGPDCSQRTCYFSAAFVDTPQGDLNADGRVSKANVYNVTITSATDEDTGTYGDTNTIKLAAGTLLKIDDDGTSCTDCTAEYTEWGVPSHDNSWAVTAVESVAYKNTGGKYEMVVLVTTPNGKAPGVGSMANGGDAKVHAAAADAGKSAYEDLKLGGGSGIDDWKVTKTQIEAAKQPFIYNTQFSNKQTWEQFPANHASAMASGKQKRFYDEAHFYAECSGKGTCNRDTGECECFDGYSGSGCAQLACPNACSGHGVCKRVAEQNAQYTKWDRHKTTSCVCDPGYTNVDCSDRVCPSGDDPITRNQVPTIQSFGYVAAATGGSFALEFKDEFGDYWATSTLGYDATAAQVEAALEALPNKVVQDVQVSLQGVDKDMITGVAADGKMWIVTFLSNSGDVADMGVRYSLTVGGEAYTHHANGGKFQTLIVCAASTDKNCLQSGSGEQKTGASALNTWFDTSGTAFGTASDEWSIQPDTAAPVMYSAKVQAGTNENTLCSSRGLCDYSTGLCKCFNGFTDDDCSRQNALAMY